jgi:hypothetical protein
MGSCAAYQPPKFDKVVLQYTDQSLTPQQQRSYTITVSSEQSIVVINASGKNVANKIYRLESPTFDKLKTLAQKIQAPSDYKKKLPERARHKLRLLNGEKVVYHLVWDDPNKLKSPTLSLVKAVKILIPDLDKLLQTPPQAHLG